MAEYQVWRGPHLQSGEGYEHAGHVVHTEAASPAGLAEVDQSLPCKSPKARAVLLLDSAEQDDQWTVTRGHRLAAALHCFDVRGGAVQTLSCKPAVGANTKLASGMLLAHDTQRTHQKAPCEYSEYTPTPGNQP